LSPPAVGSGRAAAAPRVVSWSPGEPGPAVEEAGRLLAAGHVVAHPTETVYGLAAAGDLEEGYRALLEIKGGATPRAFLLLFDGRARVVERLGDLPPGGDALAGAFWPGPLTLLFPAPAEAPAWWSGPDGDVAARVSPHPFCRALIAGLEGPILSTSANLAGEPPCANAAELARAFAATRLALVVDGGLLAGLPSTLLRWTEERGWTLLRSGPVSDDAIRGALEPLGGVPEERKR
jgi:L-threonylcarbamoyladenylate synthase